jgi:hypothetical protein
VTGFIGALKGLALIRLVTLVTHLACHISHTFW